MAATAWWSASGGVHAGWCLVAPTVCVNMGMLRARTELLGKMFIINAPATFQLIWSAVRPFLNIRTQEKVGMWWSAMRVSASVHPCACSL